MTSEDIVEIRAAVARIEASNAEMRSALIGNEDLGQEGLVARSKDHERRLRLLEKMVLIGSGAGLILAGLYTVTKDFFRLRGG